MSVSGPDFIQCVHDLHLPLGVLSPILQRLHRVVLLLFLLVCARRIITTPGLKVALGTMFSNIVRVGGIGLEGDFGSTAVTTDIEAEDLDVVVGFLCGFLTGVEFLALVDVFTAGVASHGEWCHETDFVLKIFRLLATRDEGWVEVWGEVLVEDLSLCHGGLSVEMVVRGKREDVVWCGWLGVEERKERKGRKRGYGEAGEAATLKEK